jgi:hypothetical protein
MPTTRVLIKPRPVIRRLNAFNFLAGALSLGLGLLAPFTLHIVGDLPIAEIFVPILLPVLLITRRRQMARPCIGPLLALLGLWLVGQILTDIYRQTQFLDWVRGDANIIFFGLDLLVLIGLLGMSETRKCLFIVGQAVGSLLVAKIEPSKLVADDPWKFGYAPATILLVLVVSCYFFRRNNYFVIVLLIAGISLVNIFMNFRSVVLFLLVTLAITVPLVPERVGRLRLMPPPGTTGRVMAMAAMALAAGALAAGAIKLATVSGVLGQDAQEKNEKQSQSVGGVLLGGRPEILVSSRAIFDSPILGHGSWAKDPKYEEMLADIQARFGIEYSVESREEQNGGLIPSHSYLLGSWVSAGVLGSVFWFYLLTKLMKSMVSLSLLRPALMPVYVYLLVHQFWDILFSPFASTQRMFAALIIVIMFDLLEQKVPAVATQRLYGVRAAAHSPRLWKPSFR